MMLSVYLHKHDVLTVLITVQLRAYRVDCPIRALVITVTISSNVIGALAALFFTNYSVQL